VIFRGFGRAGAEATALALAKLAQARGLVLLIGQDEALAARVGAAGVHLPERDRARARRLKARHPRWIITLAAHSPMALTRAGMTGADAALISTVFPSRSPTAGRPMGPARLGLMLKGMRLPVFALGGVTGANAGRLIGTGVAGFAAVEALSPLRT
jgi:thiamine-phosphate pyrophosphorylase